MNVLEKILEKIKEIEENYVVGHKVLFALGATGMATEIEEIIRSHMDEAENDDWIDCQKVMPGQDMDKKPVWIVYGSPMHLSVKFAYCEWILAEDEYGNDDSYNQFYIPQAPWSYYPSPNLVHYWKAVNIPKFKKE